MELGDMIIALIVINALFVGAMLLGASMNDKD